MTEKDYAKKYKRCEQVSKNECYVGSKNCHTCMYCVKHDKDFIPFENNYCTVVKKE